MAKSDKDVSNSTSVSVKQYANIILSRNYTFSSAKASVMLNIYIYTFSDVKTVLYSHPDVRQQNQDISGYPF